MPVQGSRTSPSTIGFAVFLRAGACRCLKSLGSLRDASAAIHTIRFPTIFITTCACGIIVRRFFRYSRYQVSPITDWWRAEGIWVSPRRYSSHRNRLPGASHDAPRFLRVRYPSVDRVVLWKKLRLSLLPRSRRPVSSWLAARPSASSVCVPPHPRRSSTRRLVPRTHSHFPISCQEAWRVLIHAGLKKQCASTPARTRDSS